MNPKLLRPKASGVRHPEAEAWRTAVIANGGSVSSTTFAAVNVFCQAIDSAGLRGRFYRLNPFAGGNLSSALVPLYRGPSPSGTQYGNAIDAGVNFVSGDYVETGTSGGVTGNGTTKYIQTAFPGNTLATGNRHLSAYESKRDTGSYKAMLGTQDDGAGTYYFTLTNGSPGTTVTASFGTSTSSTGNLIGGHWAATDVSATSLSLYKNGSSVSFSAGATRALPSVSGILVFATNGSPGILFPNSYYGGRMNAYSIGLGLSAAEAASYYTAMQAFQTALSRTAIDHAEALAWRTAVIANGGSVSDSTFTAVNTFCKAIDTAGIRSLFVRLNLFCGTGLAAALVPLYRGQSIGGTQWGNTTDTNTNFVSGDYSESTGLQGNGTSKSLDTGAAGNLVSVGARHLAAYERINATTDYSPSLVHYTTASNTHWRLGPWTNSNNYIYSAFAGVGGQPILTKAIGFMVGVNDSTTVGKLYYNGGTVSTTSGGTPSSVDSSTVKVFGTPAGEWSEACLGGYSIGQGFTGGQVISYYNAMQAFQTALGRNV